MKILVTGAGGFIGRNLLLSLSGRHDIFAIDRDDSLLKFVKENALDRARARVCDLTDGASVQEVADGWGEDMEAVVYLAGNGDPAYSVGHPKEDLRDTALGLLTFFNHFRAQKVIYFSSGAVYDGLSGPVSPRSFLDPRLPYAISKLASEFYIKFFQKNGRIGGYNILRFFGAYGPYEPPRKIYTRLVKAFYFEKTDRFAIRGDGKNLIDAMCVSDTVEAVGKALESEAKNVVVDLCVGNPITLRRLVEEAARIFGVDAAVVTEGSVPEYIEFRPSAEGMRRLFGFSPGIPLSEGLPALARFLEGVNR